MSSPYPRKADVVRALDAVRASGLKVGMVELSPNGAIRIFDAQAKSDEQQSDFDKWEAAGKL